MALTTIIISVTLISHVSARGFLSFMSSRLLSLSLFLSSVRLPVNFILFFMVLHSSNLGTKCSSFAREETTCTWSGGVSVWILWCFRMRTWRRKRNKKRYKKSSVRSSLEKREIKIKKEEELMKLKMTCLRGNDDAAIKSRNFSFGFYVTQQTSETSLSALSLFFSLLSCLVLHGSIKYLRSEWACKCCRKRDGNSGNCNILRRF